MNYINILGFYAFRSENWLVGPILRFLFLCDRAIYYILEKVYILFSYLCDLNLEELSDLFTNLIDRVFALVGVVLLFALALKILDAIVNPDGSFIKNSKQFGVTLFTTVAILMLTMPISGNRGIIFRYLDEIEDVFLMSREDGDPGLILKILFGGGSNQITNISDEAFGRQMAKSILMQFVVLDENAGVKVATAYNNVKNCTTDTECGYGDLADVLDKKEIAYYPFISGLAGIYMIYILVKFSLTAVRRCFELLVLEVLTPIFVLFRLDDKTKNIWNSFVSRYKDVYLKLFILTFSFYFGIMLVNNVLVYASKNIFWGNTVAIETTNSAATSLLAMNVSAAGVDAPQGFAGVLFTIVLIIGILGFVSSMPDVICGLLGIKSDENVQSFGAFLGGAAGSVLGGLASVGGAALSLGGSAVANGFNKATDGKFGEFVIDKRKKIKDAFAGNGFYATLENDNNKRKSEQAEQQLNNRWKELYDKLSKEDSTTTGTARAATTNTAATGASTTGTATAAAINTAATGASTTGTATAAATNTTATGAPAMGATAGTSASQTTYYKEEFDKILNRENKQNSVNNIATSAGTSASQATYYKEDFDKILNRENKQNSVNNIATPTTTIKVENSGSTEKPKREIPTGNSRPEMPQINANGSRSRVGQSTGMPGVRKVELPDNEPQNLRYESQDFTNLLELKRKIDEGNSDLSTLDIYSDLRKQYKPLTESEYLRIDELNDMINNLSYDYSISDEEIDKFYKERDELIERLYANNGFINEDTLANESRNIEDVVKKSNNSIRNDLNEALKAEGTNSNNYYKDHEEFSKAENTAPNIEQNIALNIEQNFGNQNDIREFYNNNGDNN